MAVVVAVTNAMPSPAAASVNPGRTLVTASPSAGRPASRAIPMAASANPATATGRPAAKPCEEVPCELRSGRNRAASRADMLRVERAVSWVDTERDLQLVRAPVLLRWGSRDRYLSPQLIERFATRRPTVEHHVLADGGHSLHDDCPEQTYALLIPFLRRAP
jgi:pimeloyl-ACP methyl ester carboxylesterase